MEYDGGSTHEKRERSEGGVVTQADTRQRGIDRRGFLRGGGGAVLGLGLLHLVPRGARAETPPAGPPAGAVGYRDWRDVWRARWTWDRVVHSSHARANCVSTCSWNVFVREGIAWREEQNAIYLASEPGVPDFNPRGCQKGACFTHTMYEPSRIVHPLERVGERGSRKWKRISWDAALGKIADTILDTAVAHGTGAVLYDHGTTNVDFGADTASEMRFFSLLGSTQIDSWAGVGDMPHGLVQTWGMYNVAGTSDDWFKSDFIVVWSANPAYTRIPESHFMQEARYRGAKLVVITPDYNATAVHADTWLNPRVGSDVALALAMAQVILAEDLHDADYVREQTDLPILVREDTGRYLRGSDLREGASDALLYFWDESTNALTEVPGCEGEGGNTLALGALRPALAGRYAVTLADGQTVEVRPLLEGLRDHLDREYTPEKAARITGVGSVTIRRVARELAAAERVLVFPGLGSCKHYHGDLLQRAQILLVALTGNEGKSGAGVRVASWWPVEGQSRFTRTARTVPLGLRMRMLWRSLTGAALTWRDFEGLLQELTPYGGTTPLMPFLYVHAGYREIWDRAEFHDPAVPRPTSAYMQEAIEKGWIPIRPAPGTDPKVFVFTGANPLRRWPAPQFALAHLWPKLDLVVDVNFKGGTSGLYADLILPACGYYERDSLKYSQAYLPYLVLCEKAVEPLGESKPEWEIFGLLARTLQQRSQAREVSSVRTAAGGETDGSSTRAIRRRLSTGSSPRRGSPDAGATPTPPRRVCSPSSRRAAARTRSTRSGPTTSRAAPSSRTSASSRARRRGRRCRVASSS
jgi:DMSO reductase family type II enzyme molybdopterin subunit